uniref:Uncharacterized protein n=2 Tax=Clytia hemisphaerica TaxID=252671 RepID=A0A7M5WVA6_9CNID
MKSEGSNRQDITCKPNTLTESACNYVKSKYHYDYHTYKCGKGEGEPTLNICTFQEQSTTFKCNHKACGAKFNGSIYIQLFDTNRTGWHYTIKPGYNDSESLERAVLKFAKRSSKFADDFMFLVCQGTNQLQLLHFDATHFKEPKANRNDKNSPQTKNKTNINVIWLDSVSRRHFFLSLPKTINQIREINTNESTKAEVIDFELMQAVHGHTHLNTFPFFEGRVLPETMSGKQKSNTLPNMNKLFNFMRSSGYKNLYQEDMCYKGFYGLNEMLNGGKTWKKLSKKLKNLQIDDLGITMASCKIIHFYKSKQMHTFNMRSLPQICYNGINLNTYFLQHITSKLKKTTHSLFSFTMLSIPHDQIGRRIQGIDQSVAEFFSVMSRMKNTITFFFADHGNSYTPYIYSELDARYEQHHPHFFAILPENVVERLGPKSLDTLRQNRLRLTSIMDIHHTIKHIANSSHPHKGLFEEISPNRTCDDIELNTPNYCVCQGWDSPMTNTSGDWKFAEFAVGYLNNMISSASPRGHCKWLLPTSFENLNTRKHDTIIQLTMDIVTNPGLGSTNKEEKFSVQVQYDIHKGLNSFHTRFLTSNRISKYGGYAKCSDTSEKDLHLCVCDLIERTSKSSLLLTITPSLESVDLKSHKSSLSITGENSASSKKLSNTSDKLFLDSSNGFEKSINISSVLTNSNLTLKSLNVKSIAPKPYDLAKLRTAKEFKIQFNHKEMISKIMIDINKTKGNEREIHPLDLIQRSVFERKTPVSTTFEVINYSHNQTFEVTILFYGRKQAKLMNTRPCKGVAKPKSMRYLCTTGKGIPNYKVNVKTFH